MNRPTYRHHAPRVKPPTFRLKLMYVLVARACRIIGAEWRAKQKNGA